MLKWLFPPLCLCCDKESTTLFCAHCQQQISVHTDMQTISFPNQAYPWGKILENNSVSFSFYQNISKYPDLLKACIGFYTAFFLQQSFSSFGGIYVISCDKNFWMRSVANSFQKLLQVKICSSKKKCQNRNILLLCDRLIINKKIKNFLQYPQNCAILSLL